jgi:serine/threonine protein phosphatase PrpC
LLVEDQNTVRSTRGLHHKDSLKVGLCTETGERERNEDYAAFCWAPDFQAGASAVAAIADGVGGASGGRIAAELAVRSFIDGQFGLSELLGVRRTAVRSLDAINGWIHSISRRDAELAAMASTFTALVFRGRRGFLLHVGDTRLYRLRENSLEVLTIDHTFRLPGYRNVLTRAIGSDANVKIDYSELSLSECDRYLLCTDGVHSCLDDDRIRLLLEQLLSPEETARELVNAAFAISTGDNATALVIDVLTLPPPDMADLSISFATKPILPIPKLGAKVDGFHLTKLLSDGRYSCVFRAHDESGNREVVIKFPKPNTASEAVFRRTFMRETWVAQKVRSPFVGKTLEVADDRRSGIYVVMPFYEGETLESRLSRQTRTSFSTGLDLALKLAKATAALHRVGVIHRDIKPENIVIEPPRPNEGTGLKLIDLGVARLPDMEAALDVHAPENWEGPGTPSYMAPELFDGAPGDELSDQFALGVTIYRMFTGKYPYGEIEPFSHPRFRNAIPLQARRSDLPGWLDQVISRAVAVKPDERFHDVLELVFELEHGAMRALPLEAEPRSLYQRHPLAFWKVTAVLLFCALILALHQLAELYHIAKLSAK